MKIETRNYEHDALGSRRIDDEQEDEQTDIWPNDAFSDEGSGISEDQR